MDTNRSAWWAWAAKNSVCVICFTVLAIMFDKWWIALFAGLFMSSLKTADPIQYCMICDKCGKHSPAADNYNDSLELAKENGWVHIKAGDKWEDYCPECQDREV